MYQEETYEPNDDGREEAQLADEKDRYEAGAEEAHERLWMAPAVLPPAGNFRRLMFDLMAIQAEEITGKKVA